ncbi:MAG: dockerin type I domain-containing protein [Phycisphaerales bacterium]|nr:dockerin type I domain-containing protein [Phycisphaerales bacterium]
MVTLSYTPAGDLAWIQLYADPNGGPDRSTRIAVDGAFNVFVSGDAWVGFENYDFTTIRYMDGGSPADLDGSGSVDVIDLLALIGAWGACPPGSCAADLNPDGTVNVLDLLLLIANWG